MREHRHFSLLVILLIASGTRPASGYSQFTHAELIDLAWADSIRPLLLHRYPQSTERDLTRAHAYAYGGSLLQDVGYYPFGKRYFSDLTHYVRSGDFIDSLLRNARTMNELAFAIGALSHYVGDSIGHKESINPATALTFPQLRATYGDVVTYEDAPTDHVRTEFGFDVAQSAWDRYAPRKYRKRIGFRFARQLLYRAFSETYGFPAARLLGPARSALASYRWSAGFLVPVFLRAQIVLLRGRLPGESADEQQQQFLENIAHSEYATTVAAVHSGPGFSAHLVAALIWLTPKIGRLKMLDIKAPDSVTEDLFLSSVNDAGGRFRSIVAALASSDLRTQTLSNLDLDTGNAVRTGESKLVDTTHARLQAELQASRHGVPVNLQTYFSGFYAK